MSNEVMSMNNKQVTEERNAAMSQTEETARDTDELTDEQLENVSGGAVNDAQFGRGSSFTR